MRAIILRDNVSAHTDDFGTGISNLRDDFEPCIDFNLGEICLHSMANVVVCTKLEPQGQESQNILQCIFTLKRD